MSEIPYDEFRRRCTNKFTVEQLYHGVTEDGKLVPETASLPVSQKLLVPTIRQRQHRLVLRTGDIILQIAAEQALTELEEKHINFDSRIAFDTLREKALVPDGIGYDEYWEAVKEYETQEFERQEFGRSREREGESIHRLGAVLMGQDILLHADRIDLGSYDTDIREFREGMNDYRERLHAYIEKVKARLPVLEAYRLTSPGPQELKKTLQNKQQLQGYLKELDIYRSEIERFRDGGELPAFTPPPPNQHALDGLAQSGFGKLPKPPFREVPQHPIVDFVNANFAHIASIRETGTKSLFSTLDKWRRRTGNEETPPSRAVIDFDKHKLLDLNRITVSPVTPFVADRFNALLANPFHYITGGGFTEDQDHMVCDRGWRMTKDGYIDRKLNASYKLDLGRGGRANLLPAELKIEEKNQLEADMLAHKVYEVKRLLMDEDGNFTTRDMNPQIVERLAERYNQLMQYFARLDPNYLVDREPLTAEKAQANLRGVYDRLRRLNQSVHVVAAQRSSPEWQEIYLREAHKCNAEYRAQKDRLIAGLPDAEERQRQRKNMENYSVIDEDLLRLVSNRSDEIKTTVTQPVVNRRPSASRNAARA